MIKVKAVTATYAIASGTSLGRGADIVKGAITGSAPKVNKLREITEAELEQCECSLRSPLYVLGISNMYADHTETGRQQNS